MLVSTSSLLMLGSERSSTKYGPRVTFVAWAQELDELLELLDVVELEFEAALHPLNSASSKPAAPLAKTTLPTRMTSRRVTSFFILPPGARSWNVERERPPTHLPRSRLKQACFMRARAVAGVSKVFEKSCKQDVSEIGSGAVCRVPRVAGSLARIRITAQLPLIDVKVRRERRLDFSGCNSRPGTGSLHPVAIEAAAEATKLSELSMERVAWRLRERAGHNVSKR